MQPQSFPLENIAVIHTPFKQKFAIPRQPGLVKQAVGRIELIGPYNNPDTVRGLAQFSHLWLIFLFSENLKKGWTPTIRPPRLGGNDRMGVFASRSTFRPNGLGMSVVELVEVRQGEGGTEIVVAGVDLLDKTPIVDIKPYIPYSDSIGQASGGYADQAPQTAMTVSFTPQAMEACHTFEAQYPQLQRLIENLLKQDPRPAYKKKATDDKVYSVELYELEVKWQVAESHTQVLSVTPLATSS